tara:strand:- start:26296 stop:26595 length:300 start_codon:yes stop_codon:yes gene_type:complete
MVLADAENERTMKKQTSMNGVDFHRVDNDVNGNPRYVVHFLSLAANYDRAIEIARKIGGKKYRAKWFGGGIVFQSYNIVDLAQDILSHTEYSNTGKVAG